MKTRSNPIRYYAMLIRVMTSPVPGHRRVDARTSEPVTFGVPLPQGFTKNPTGWAITAASDGAVAPIPAEDWRAAQTRVVDHWPDGSARWVLVDARVDALSGYRVDLVIDTTKPEAKLADSITAVEKGGAVFVDTGAARFELRPGLAFPFAGVESTDSLIDANAGRLVAVDRDGNVREAQISDVTIETAGLLRTVVRLDGSIDLGGRALTVVVRVHFFAGLATVKLRLSLTNPDPAKHEGGFWDLGDPGSILFRDISLVIALKDGTAPLTISCSAETGKPQESESGPFEIYQDSSGGEAWKSANHINRERRVPLTFRGYRLRSAASERSGLRATPTVTVQRDGKEAGVVFPRFWQNFPKAIEVDASARALTVRLFPAQFNDLHELQGGEQKTHDCWVAFGADRVSSQPLEWCRQPTLACVDPQWTYASDAVTFFAPLDSEHASLVSAAVEGPDRFELKREVIDEFGWRHFGEIYGDHEAVRQQNPPLVSHYNNQYDVVAGLVLQYLRTADPRWWSLADELASHVIDVDIYHTQGDKSSYNGGLFWHTYHYGDADSATHRSYPRENGGRIHGGGPSADHNYTTGLMLHHFLTGDEASRSAVVGLANYVTNMDDGRQTIFKWLDHGDTGRAISSAPDYYGPGRGPANSLTALIDGFRVSGDRRLFAKAEQLVRRVIHPADDIARHDLDTPEERWFYTMFLQALSRFIQFKRERNELDDTYQYARASLLHYARWMADHTYPYLDKPEKLRYPTETWPAQDMRKSDVFFAAAYESADADERARFLERGEFFFRHSLDTLAGFPTRTYCRPLAVLLTSGLFRTSLAGKTACDQQADPASFGRPSVFVPQRKRAERRIKQLVGLTGLAVVSLVAWALSR